LKIEINPSHLHKTVVRTLQADYKVYGWRRFWERP